MYPQGLIFTADTPITRTFSNLVSCPPDVAPTSYLLLPSAGEEMEEKKERKKRSLVQTYAERVKLLLQPNVAILTEKNAPYLSEIDQIKVYEIFVNLRTSNSSSSPLKEILYCPFTQWSFTQFFERYFIVPVEFNCCGVKNVEFPYEFKPAVDDGNLHLLKGLLSRKPDIPCIFGEGVSFPLLHLAAKRCCLVLVRALLDHGANVHSKSHTTQFSSHGKTPLHHAVMGGSSEIVQLLCQRGADVDAYDSDGFTPLYFAEHPDVANVLLENHANPRAVCGENQLIEEKLRWQYVTKELFRVFFKYGVWYFDDCRESGNRLLKSVGESYDDSDLFSCILESCFIGPDRLQKLYSYVEAEENIRPESWADLRRYASKITALFQNPQFDEFVSSKHTNDVVRAFNSYVRLADYEIIRLACDEEVARMKCHIFAGATASVFDLLMKNELEVARLLKNEVFASMVDSLEWDEFNNQFPLYCTIFRYHLENGSHRKQFQEEARKIIDSLSLHFKRLPSEIQEYILDFLRMRDLVDIKRVLALPSDS